MSDEQNVSGQNVAPTQEGTTQQVQDSTPPRSEDNVQSEATASPSESSHEEMTRAEKRELGKISQLERKARELEEKNRELERVAQSYTAIENTFKGDSSSYEAFRQAWKKQSGVDLGDYKTRFGEKEASQPAQETSVNGQINQQKSQQTSSVDIDQIEQQVSTKMEMKRKWQDAFENIVKEFPEFDPKKVNEQGEQERLAASQKWNTITKMAVALAFDNNGNPKMDLNEAVKQAAYALPENKEKYLAKIREEGKMQGQAEAYAGGAASASGLAGSNTSRGRNEGRLTPEELEVGRQLGLSEEELLKNK